MVLKQMYVQVSEGLLMPSTGLSSYKAGPHNRAAAKRQPSVYDPSRRTPIKDLPEELLEAIFAYISETSQKSVASVSRTFNRVVTYILYRSFHHRVNKAAAAFLSTVIRHPSLGSLVRELDFTDTSNVWNWRRGLRPQSSLGCESWPLTIEQKRLIDRQISHHPLPEWYHRFHYDEPMYIGRVILMILCWTPNVQSLIGPKVPRYARHCTSEGQKSFIIGRWRIPKDVISTMDLHPSLGPLACTARGRESLCGERHSFDKLTTLLVHIDSIKGERVSCLFKLLALQKLYLVSLDDYYTRKDYLRETDDETTEWECEDFSSTVTHLTFAYAIASRWTVKRAILSCKNLRSFSYAQEQPSGRFRWYTVVTNALRRHRDTLEHISITDDHLEAVFDHRLGPIDDFTALKYLNAPFYLLLGRPPWNGSANLDTSLLPRALDFSRMFPSSLETLRLATSGGLHEDERPIQRIRALAPTCRTLEHLQSLTVDFMVSYNDLV